MIRIIALLALLLTSAGCTHGHFDPFGDLRQAEELKRAEDEAWNAPCADTSTLLATTAGSPSQQTCPNKHHKMRVTLASAPSNAEFGAVVFCECVP